MNNDKKWEQLAKYFAGELSKEENQIMETWIKSDPAREEEIDRLYEVWKETKNTSYELDVDKAWLKLSGNMDVFEKNQRDHKLKVSGIKHYDSYTPGSPHANTIKRAEIKWRRVMLVAATILIIASAGYFSFYYTQMQHRAAEVAAIENRVFVTRNGERATYILSDGTKVMLHAGSRLEIPDKYNQQERELFLEGEAYFEVTHDDEKPFIVRSERAYTRVLGTRFLVQAWPESDEVEVVVSEGKVAFGNHQENNAQSENEVLITRNKMGVIAEGKEPVVAEVTDINWYLGWTEGRLEFENRPLSEVLPRLERWYDIDIQVEDEKICQKKITAEIDYSQSMSEVLQGIALTLELEVERVDRSFMFRSPE